MVELMVVLKVEHLAECWVAPMVDTMVAWKVEKMAVSKDENLVDYWAE